jgi:hypothetical protein
MTSIESRFAFGVVPEYPDAPSAAMPATNVPWPYPSPGEFGPRLARFTCASTREPKSARVAWMPESTIAIVGELAVGEYQLTFTFAAGTQPCELLYPDAATVSFGTIDVAAPLCARRRICLPVSVSSAPSMESNCCLTSLGLTFSSLEPLLSSRILRRKPGVLSFRSPWRITSNDWLGSCAMELSSVSATYDLSLS